MIVDTSVIVSILIDEPEALRFAELIARHDCQISAGSWVEVGVVMTRRFGSVAAERPELIRQSLRIAIAPVSAGEATLTHEAYRLFGQGSGHKAKLNFGDCFAYALAKVTGEPLLFKGNDFTYTDIVPAIR